MPPNAISNKASPPPPRPPPLRPRPPQVRLRPSVSELPRTLGDVIERAWAHEPEARPAATDLLVRARARDPAARAWRGSPRPAALLVRACAGGLAGGRALASG